MPTNLDGLVWLLLLLGPLLFLQRHLHREIQSVFLLLTHRPEVALALFSLLFFPGVLLHETSHYIMARLLRVRTGHFSLLPQPLPNGRLQLGYVETVPADVLRDALIGMAPLLTGGLFVSYAGVTRLGLGSLWALVKSGQSAGLGTALANLTSQPDIWLWFYLTFTICSTMLPSASDRRAWLPISLVLTGLLIIGLLMGAGPWLFEYLAPPFNTALRALSVVIGISVLLHLVLLPPTWALRRLLSRLTGYQVV
jgi:hypothetical protein